MSHHITFGRRRRTNGAPKFYLFTFLQKWPNLHWNFQSPNLQAGLELTWRSFFCINEALKHDMMSYEILRPSFFSAHYAYFLSRWSLLKGGGLHIRSWETTQFFLLSQKMRNVLKRMHKQFSVYFYFFCLSIFSF